MKNKMQSNELNSISIKSNSSNNKQVSSQFQQMNKALSHSNLNNIIESSSLSGNVNGHLRAKTAPNTDINGNQVN